MLLIRLLAVSSYFFNFSLSQAAFVKRLVEHLMGSNLQGETVFSAAEGGQGFLWGSGLSAGQVVGCA